MHLSIEWLSTFILNYPLLKYLIVFLGAGFGGEFGLISLAFLAAHKVFPLIPFLIVSFLGTMSSDTLWFLWGKTKLAGKIISHRYTAGTVSVIMEAIRKISRGNHLLALILAKFLVGTRILVIMYVSKTNIAFKKFILPDLVAILIWLITLTSIGYLSGLGFAYISKMLKNIYAGIGFIILIVFIIIIIQIWLKRFFLKKEEEIIKQHDL